MDDKKSNVDGMMDGVEKRTRQRSKIEFPYHDQDSAIKVVEAIHSNAGSKCSIDQLAAYLIQSPRGGAFRMRVSSARIFSLIETERGGEIRLTSLGQNILNPNFEKQARVESFLSVELYKAVYDKFKSHMLPPARAMEQEFESFGVTSKSKSVARQVFERSARQAGFFDYGDEKLIKPTTRNYESEPVPIQTKQHSELPTHRAHSNVDGLHPLIEGLLKELPDPNSEWQLEARLRWLQAATNIFALIYSDDSDKSITIDGNGNISLGNSGH